MSDRTSRRQSRAAAGLPPITAAKIVDAAVELTAETGLENWSIRQISSRLEVWPGVVAHHVGDREAVVAAVVDRVTALIPTPDPELPWREWFRTLMLDGRKVLRGYPGVARRIVVGGPTSPSAMSIIDTGIKVLQRAGFGDRSTVIYRYLLNSVFMLVAVEDDQQNFPGARDSMRRMLTAYSEDSDRTGLASAAAQASGWRTDDPEHLAQQAVAFFELTAERSLDGAAAMLPPEAPGRRPCPHCGAA